MNPCLCERFTRCLSDLDEWGLHETLAHARIHCKLQHFLTKLVTRTTTNDERQLIASELNLCKQMYENIYIYIYIDCQSQSRRRGQCLPPTAEFANGAAKEGLRCIDKL